MYILTPMVSRDRWEEQLSHVELTDSSEMEKSICLPGHKLELLNSMKHDITVLMTRREPLMNEVDPNTNPSVAAVDDGYDQLSLEENEHGLSARSILWISLWHTIPRSIATLFRRNGTLPNGDEIRNMLSMQEYPVFIYLHGTTFDRANWHRIILYNLLNDMDYHVIAFDYRENCKNNTVIIWGHSMGSAITTRMAKELSLEGRPPQGIVLEGAYDNLRNAFMTNWFSFPLHWVPDRLIEPLVVDRLADVGLTMMRSDEHIKRVACPILMLHAEDDHIVKVSLARALRRAQKMISVSDSLMKNSDSTFRLLSGADELNDDNPYSTLVHPKRPDIDELAEDRRRVLLIILISVVLLIVVIILLIFVGIPALVFAYPQLLKNMFFQDFKRYENANYSNMSVSNVTSIGREFHLQGAEGKLGVWHILPQAMAAYCKRRGIHPTKEEMEAALAWPRYPVVIYFHGNSYDRTTPHRVEMYNLLTKLNYHVITFDYRGFGDSPGVPTEDGVVADSRVVHSYVKSRCGSNRVPFFWIPRWFLEKYLLQRIESVGMTLMETDQRIKNVTCRILILHAEDDVIIPVQLGRKVVIHWRPPASLMREAGSTDDSAAISQKPSESSISIAVDDQDSNTNLAGEVPSDRSERSFLRRFWCVICLEKIAKNVIFHRPLICAIEIVIVILGVIFLGIPLLLYVFPELFTMMHILPRSLSANYKSGVKILDTDRIESYLALTDYPVIVYFHGNSYDRATQQRIAMYNVFSDLNYHVITFDYRGFGDSDGPATEEGLVKDCHLVY
ncbi:unnamed protein product, partial [Nippostrongylus brasiliensis]|uniref:Lysophosphatidylserine lipase ABHD12 n=1 Tax=Nippostrongylus brasiliensis TaxID=27835 RepID=A0A158R2V3_NIPBR